MTPPRTPADIGRDIAAAEQRIRDLKAELVDVPPREQLIHAPSEGYDAAPGERTLRCSTTTTDVALLHATYYESTVAFRLDAKGRAKLKAWLNHYYPEA